MAMADLVLTRRSQPSLKDLEVTSSPLWNLAFLILKVNSVASSLASKDSQASGTISPFSGSYSVRASKSWYST